MNPPSGLELEVIRDEARLAGLAAEWSALLAHAVAGGPHLTHDWIVRCWRRHRGRRRVRLNLMTVRDGGRLVLVAPLLSHRGLLGFHSLFWIDSRTPFYCDLLLEDSQAGRDASRLLAATLATDPWMRKLVLHSVRADAAARSLLRFLPARERGRPLTTRAIDLAAFADGDAFLKALSHKRRGSFKRLQRRLAERGTVAFERVTEADDIRREIAWLLTRKRDQFAGDAKPSHWLSDAGLEEFFGQAAADGVATGRCLLQRLCIGERTIASVLCFREGDVLFVSKMAHDPEWGAFSPGSLLNLLIVQQSFAAGIKRIDMMLGDHAWKRGLANAGTSVRSYRIPGRLFSLGAEIVTNE